jgi:hypothetical protein
MRALRWLLLGVVVVTFTACGGGGKNNNKPDGGGSDATQPKCNDGIDNDGDGKTDYPADPGCYSPNQDDETDDCPDGPNCPQCSNGKDDDMNGQTDYPADPGCAYAADTDEYTENPAACGGAVHIQHLPPDNHKIGMLMGSMSNLQGACGGAGTEDVYELRIQHPKVVVASTEGSTADTVLYIRSASCADPNMEVACNDDISTTDHSSTVTASIATPGTYYLVVDSKSATGGAYNLTVQFLVGEGDPCSVGDDCGPGLVCRVPLNGTTKVCAKHVCSDGVDDDGDGKNDYPNDPGCTSATDDDEMDDCPSGPNCPECGNGIDDDHDGKTDYPMDLQCQSAASTSEACQSHEAVPEITTATTQGDTTLATSDFDPTCAFDTGIPDLTYRIDVPALSSLTITSTTTTWSSDVELLNDTCGGTALQCAYGSISATNVAAGAYYVVVDGDFSGDVGPFTLTVAGTIQNNASCESPLAQSGALVCGTGYACKGTMGSRTCAPATCSDGIDNDHDGKIDYPFDPGCTDPADDDETDPATLPVCSNGSDDDTDGQADFPADYGCASAGGTSEVFCTGEMDPTALVTTKTTTGTTTGKSNDHQPMLCSLSSSSAASDVAYALQLPVAVQSLQIDTIGSAFDTMIYLRDTQCGADIACDDDGGGTGNTSMMSLTNVLPGGYAIVIDGYSSANGAYTLNVQGTVAPGTSCASPLFSGGANAVLLCPTGTTCTGTPKKCM